MKHWSENLPKTYAALIRAGLVLVVMLNLGFGKILTGSVFSRLIFPISAILLVGLCVLCVLAAAGDKAYWRRVRNLSVRLAVIYEILAGEMLFTLLYHGASFENVLSQASHFAIFLAVYPLTYLFVRDGGIEKVLKVCVGLAALMLLIKTTNWFMYNRMGIVLNNDILFEFGAVWRRGGLNRVLDSCLGGIAIAWFAQSALSKKALRARIAYILAAAAYVAVVYLISDARAALICQSALLLSMILYFFRSSVRKLAIPLLIIVVLAVVLNMGTLIRFVETFTNQASSYYSSTEIRMDSFTQYFEFFKKTPFFGIGIFTADEYTNLLKVPGNYAFSDLGVLGMILRYGAFGLVTFLLIYTRAFSLMRRLINKTPYDSFVVGLMVYFTFASVISMNLFDYQRILAVPFILATFEYLNWQKDEGLPA